MADHPWMEYTYIEAPKTSKPPPDKYGIDGVFGEYLCKEKNTKSQQPEVTRRGA